MKSWHINLVIEDGTDEQAKNAFDEIIRLLDSRGLTAAGGMHYGNKEASKGWKGA